MILPDRNINARITYVQKVKAEIMAANLGTTQTGLVRLLLAKEWDRANS